MKKFSNYKYNTDLCNNHSGIPSNRNRNKYQTKINNIKPRYMNSYYEKSSSNTKNKEKIFNYLLNNYYNNYNKIKTKYKFDDNDKLSSEEDEKKNYINNNYDYDDFIEAKNNIYSLFLTHDKEDIDNVNFNITDSIINSMRNDNNNILIKNTQIKDDYNLRLNDSLNRNYPGLKSDENEEIEVEDPNERESELKKEDHIPVSAPINTNNNKENNLPKDNIIDENEKEDEIQNNKIHKSARKEEENKNKDIKKRVRPTTARYNNIPKKKGEYNNIDDNKSDEDKNIEKLNDIDNNNVNNNTDDLVIFEKLTENEFKSKYSSNEKKNEVTNEERKEEENNENNDNGKETENENEKQNDDLLEDKFDGEFKEVTKRKDNEENKENKGNEDSNKEENNNKNDGECNDELKEQKSIKNENYSLDNIQLTIEKVQKIPLKLTDEEVQIEIEPKREEKTTDTFDLEKREIKITTKKILKKTNVLRREFKNNEICPDTKLNIYKINENQLEKNNVINKIQSFTLNKMENEIKDKDSDIIEKKKLNFDTLETEKKEDKKIFLGNNIIIRVNNIQLLGEKLQKYSKDITEYTFGDNNQLSIDKLQIINKDITDKNKDVSEMGIYQNLAKEKSETDKSASYENKDFGNVVNKEQNIKIKQLMKENNKLNERYTDITNIEKNNEDSNINTFTNFDTINIEDKNVSSIDANSSINVTDENDNKDKMKKLKIKHIKKNINITNYDTNLIDNNNYKEDEIEEKNNNLDSIELNDNNRDMNKQRLNINTLSSNDNMNSLSNEIESNMDASNDNKISIEKDSSETPKEEEPRKKEIILKKRICIISKVNKKKKIEFAKRKFFEKKLLIKYWKSWKQN